MTVFRYRNKGLEGFVFIEVFAAKPAKDTNGQNPQQRGRNGYRQQVEKFKVLAVKGKVAKHCHQRDDRHGNRAGDNPHLRADRAGGHGSLRTDVIFDGDIINNRQNGIYHVPRAAKNRQRTGDEWRDDRDIFRVSPQEFLGNLQHHV